MSPLGEAVYPTDRQVVCRMSVMAKGHSAWGVFVCNLPFTPLSFVLFSFFFLFLVSADTPVPGISAVFADVSSVTASPPKMSKLG